MKQKKICVNQPCSGWPTCRDFRPGDVRDSLAEISKVAKLLGYASTHLLREGLGEVVDW